jgi:predicted choloylglycine hydrolase
MHYIGDYSYPPTGTIMPAYNDFSCSLFAALGEAGDKLYGRNFDWELSPSLLLFTDPSDGFASVSMVNLTFIGIDSAGATKLDILPLSKRADLLASPSLPFDGMNEYGLVVAMAAVPEEYADDAGYDRSKPNIGSIGIIRQILDHARNVEEALGIFEQYNIIFSGGPPIHYLLADPSGKAVLVEFYQGAMVQIPNQDAWHLATNHLRCIAIGDGGCWRYKTILDQLTKVNGQLDPQSAMQLLSMVKQSSTQWSSVYNMTTGDISVVIATHYETTYAFHLDLLKP